MSDEQDPTPPTPPTSPTDPAPLPGPDELITIAEAARLCGLAPGTLRQQIAAGRLQVQAVTPRLNMTTRRWLDAYIQSRGTRHPGAAPKPLPPGYQAPGPGRPRKPAVRTTTPTERSTADDDQQ